MDDLDKATNAASAVRSVLVDGSTAGLTVRERVALGVDPFVAFANWRDQSVRQACWRTVFAYLPEQLQQHLVELGLS
ncbi:hypothetical protein GIY62_06195 [Burkholderia plantarii]|uniref:hypothetical protein n=1 Tax=Burkholderia plantarii TaxID=41899 RepID=UPI00272CFDD3|nr:hypothetical protein [Burkholderia plantarii]WLE60248.1 hypothetical protein GIY62_06195 [Burkholderia plantarii]